MRALLPPVAIVLLLVGPFAAGSGAEVFHSRESGLRLAFPEADGFRSETVVIDEEQLAAIESRSRTRLPSRLFRLHVALAGEEIVGYAVLETHTVRSLPETLLIALHPDGRSRSVHLLAFHEPSEYLPPERWLGQFSDRPLDSELALRRGIAGIAGSTLTANAITAAVRRVMATVELAAPTAR